MKKIAIYVVACLIMSSTRISGQEIISNHTFKIHQSVLKYFQKSDVGYYVSPHTNKYPLSYFYFLDPSGVDGNPDRIWKKPEWKHFLANVDTAALANYSLSSNGKPWFKKPKKSPEPYRRLEFAPAIISKDNNKALCILSQYESGGTGGYIAFYLEREKNTWKVKHEQTIAFLD